MVQNIVRKKIIKLVVVVFILSFLFLLLIFNTYLLISLNSKKEKNDCPISCGQIDTIRPSTTLEVQPNSDIAENYEYVTVRGSLKKEKIPEELALGDNSYQLYFDEPFLLLGDASGSPLYINKIQVLLPEANTFPFYDINGFLDNDVEIYGHYTGGYAETVVIQIVAITKI